jgi:hypothetical protein
LRKTPASTVAKAAVDQPQLPGKQDPNSAFAQAIVFSPISDSDDVTGPPDADDIFTYSVVAGALPPGLTLNVFNGTISGAPTAAGLYNFTLRATDESSTPNTADQAYSINVGSVSLTVSPASLPNGTQGAAYNQTVTASGGTAPYTFSVSSGHPIRQTNRQPVSLEGKFRPYG